MQGGAPYTESGAALETSLDLLRAIDEPYACKPHALPAVQVHTQIAERREPIRHNAFTARLVDRRMRSVGKDHIEPRLAQRQRSCQSGGTTADDANLCLLDRVSHPVTSGAEPARRRSPGPSLPSGCSYPARGGGGS